MYCASDHVLYVLQISLTANARQVMIANQINTRSTNNGVYVSSNNAMVSMDMDVVRRSLRIEPYYWKLPPQFNGDKVKAVMKYYINRLIFNILFLTLDSYFINYVNIS